MSPGISGLLRSRPGVPSGAEQGSVVLLVVILCLASAVVLQTLSTVILCAERAAVDEATGRRRLAEKDQALAILRGEALRSWQPQPWTPLDLAPNERGAPQGSAEGTIVDLPYSSDWVKRAMTRQDPSISRLTASALIERGRDGIDLPLAAVVADAVTAAPGRLTAWVESESGGASVAGDAALAEMAPIRVVRPLVDPVLGSGCSVSPLSAPWRLDAGWANLDSVVAGGSALGSSGTTTAAVTVGPSVLWVVARRGGWETLPSDPGRGSPERPVLIVVTGGATLEARNMGDIYGVIVVDDGSVLLEGTTVHGAVFAGGTVELGDSGSVLYSCTILRWATDRSLNRARLVPGSREEGTE